MAHKEPLKSETGNGKYLYGYVASFDGPDALVHAAEKVRDAGFKKFDCYSPYPIHGIDDAMGTPYTPLPWLVLTGGLTGMTGGFLLQAWSNGWAYPYVISGKPLVSWQAFMPVTYECTILLSAITAFVGMLALNRLFGYYNPLFKCKSFQRITDDKFALAIDGTDPKFNEKGTAELLSDLHPTNVEACYEETAPAPLPKGFALIIGTIVMLGLIPLCVIMYWRTAHSNAPPLKMDNGMYFQAKFKPQSTNKFFGDNDKEADRKPVENTVRADVLTGSEHYLTGKAANGEFYVGLPDEIKAKDMKTVLARGENRFNIYCAICHGKAGNGDGLIHRRASKLEDGEWVPPASFHTDANRAMSDGQIFDSITWGVRKAMLGYGSRVSVDDRWAIVAYVRALQMAQSGKPDDVPAEFKGKLTSVEAKPAEATAAGTATNPPGNK